MAIATINAVATLQASVNDGTTLTVPAGVKPTHLGIAVFVSANLYSTNTTPTIPGWANRISNPSVANNMEWSVLTRLGGHTAGETFTISEDKPTQFDLYMIWYDTRGLDVNTFGPVSGRGTANSQYTAISGLTAASQGQSCIVIATERSTAAGTNIGSWSGNYTPASDSFGESLTNIYSSNFFGHFSVNSSLNTGTLTANYNTSSGNGAGVQMFLGTPTTATFLDPFNDPSYSVSQGGSWQSYLSPSAAPMSNGVLSMPFTTDYPYLYPLSQFAFNYATMAVEVWMEEIGTTSFSMRLTSDGIPEKGNSFVSVGIGAGGQLYMNQRTTASGDASSVDDFTNSGVFVNPFQPVVLRMRHTGGSTVVGEYSLDYVNWKVFATKLVTCFNPLTDFVRPMFQTGNSGTIDEWNTFARITQMNTSKFTPYKQQPRSTYAWSYWNGTKEIELPAPDNYSYSGQYYLGPQVVGQGRLGEVTGGAIVTCNIPSGVMAGDYLLAAIAHRSDSPVPTPNGWTLINQSGPGSGLGFGIGLFYKIATATEPSSYAFNVLGNSNSAAEIVRVVNVSSVDGNEEFLIYGGTSAGFDEDAGPSFDSELIVNAVVLTQLTPDRGAVWPTSDTLLANSSGVGIRLLMTAERRPVAGSVGMRQWTTGGYGELWGGIRVYLRGNGKVLYTSSPTTIRDTLYVSPSTLTGASTFPTPDIYNYPGAALYPGIYPGGN